MGVPVLMLFILLGMLFGSDGLFKIRFDNYEVTSQLSSIALIFIMFYGGFGTNWKIARPVANPAILLSTVGVLLTAFLTGLFCYFVLKMPFLEALLIGSVISSTDAASVFSILRYKKLNLKNGLASLLEIESGSNDPTAYMLTVVVLSVMKTGSGASFFKILILQAGLGLIFGYLIAKLATFALKKIHFENNGIGSIFMVAIALVSFALPSVLGGNGYLSVYITGILLGNAKIRHKIQLVHFFDGITWMMQIMLFFMIGLLSYPSKIPQIIIPAVLIALFLTFVSRPIAVFSILSPFKISFREQLLIAWSGLRGAASIVFAITVVMSDVYQAHDIFHIVFCVALLSVGFSGTLLPYVAKKLNLVDDKDPVFKTFTDYDHLSQMPLLDIVISNDHPWIGKTIREIDLPMDLLMIMIKRKNKAVLPKGATKIHAGDVLVVSGTMYQEDTEALLNEDILYDGHPWIDKTVKELKEEGNILLIKRDEASIIPHQNTVLLKDDCIVYTNK